MFPRIIFCALLLFSGWSLTAQSALPDSCKLQIGTNLAGLADWGTELAFVDLMHNAREWYTKSIDDPSWPWNSEMADFLEYRPDGYPTHIPQEIDESVYLQRVATIWAITDSWPAGTYTVLWDGTGSLDFWGGATNIQQTDPNRIIFDFPDPLGNVLEMIITESDINDPLHNIRVLMPGTEDTYESQPFYDLWLDRLAPFKTVRFMDWGQTNNWGQEAPWDWQDPSLVPWDERSKIDYYTWANAKGVPYEMMIQLMNDYDLDGWVCVPHNASDAYIENMAQLFRDELEPERHLFVEYSNETWNWIFGQTQWLNEYGCVQQNIPWPEGTVPYIQNCLDIWTDVFAGELDRITRVAGGQTGWLDVYERTVYNLDPTSFDAVTATYYFGLSGGGDGALDQLGASATVADVAFYAREEMPTAFGYIENIRQVADSLDKAMVFYEGGQHLTPHPFGEVPTYEQALLDIHRDTSMYNLYNEWFDRLHDLQEGAEPLQLMNFSFIAGRSAQYGSWGLLEFMDQDTGIIPAPKYRAVLENTNLDCQGVNTSAYPVNRPAPEVRLYPNPTAGTLFVELPPGLTGPYRLRIFDRNGILVAANVSEETRFRLETDAWPQGIYTLQIITAAGNTYTRSFVRLNP